MLEHLKKGQDLSRLQIARPSQGQSSPSPSPNGVGGLHVFGKFDSFDVIISSHKSFFPRLQVKVSLRIQKTSNCSHRNLPLFYSCCFHKPFAGEIWFPSSQLLNTSHQLSLLSIGQLTFGSWIGTCSYTKAFASLLISNLPNTSDRKLAHLCYFTNGQSLNRLK